VTPEAWEGGPIAYVEDGDTIEIDVPAGRIQLLVPEEELRLRMANPPERPDHPAHSVLAAYRDRVGGADTGAVWI